MLTLALSTVPKVPGCRLVVATFAGDPAHYAHRLLAHARGSPRWRVSEVPGPVPWQLRADLAELAALLLPADYARRVDNRWTAGHDRLATATQITGLAGGYDVLDPVPGVRYVIGLDVGLTRDRTVATVAHRDPAGRVVVDRQKVWAGTPGRPVHLPGVTAWLAHAAGDYNNARVVFDPYQAVQAAQELRAAGVRAVPFTFSAASVGRLAVALFRAIAAGRLVLPEDGELLDELANVRLRETAPGVYRIDHDSGQHDDRVISLALVVHELAGRVPVRSAVTVPSGDLAGATTAGPLGGAGAPARHLLWEHLGLDRPMTPSWPPPR
jgi:hypothetical protein